MFGLSVALASLYRLAFLQLIYIRIPVSAALSPVLLLSGPSIIYGIPVFVEL